MKAREHGYPRHYHKEAHLHIGAFREYPPTSSNGADRPRIHGKLSFFLTGAAGLTNINWGSPSGTRVDSCALIVLYTLNIGDRLTSGKVLPFVVVLLVVLVVVVCGVRFVLVGEYDLLRNVLSVSPFGSCCPCCPICE